MQEKHSISANSIDELLQKAEQDPGLSTNTEAYHITLECEGRRLLLDIDTDLITISSYLFSRNEFTFELYNENTIDQIGKFFGMQDVVSGYKEFDEKFIIKGNDQAKVIALFADKTIRDALLSYEDVTFGIVHYVMDNADGKVPFLELTVNKNGHQVQDIKTLLSIFYAVLVAADS